MRRSWQVGLVVGFFVVSGAPNALADGASPLDWRLQALASKDLRSASPAEQGDAVSLLADGAGSLMRNDGSLVVEIRVNGKTSGRVAGLHEAGAKIIDVSARYATITAAVDEDELRDVGRAPGVESVVEEITPMSGGIGDPEAAAGAINTCATGVVSEGNTQLKAGAARTQFDVDGSGIKVGVLSDSFDIKPTGLNASNDIASGDLPGPGNPCGRTTPVQVLDDTAVFNQADEGRAMIQIVHDIAPGAALAFATADTGQIAFANNIRALAAAGANVIVDDYIYFAEPMYQDGVIAQAINDVTAQGIGYYTMAFNNNGNGINSYEAPNGYRSIPCPAAVLADRAGGADSCMDFDPGAGTDPSFDVSVGTSTPFRLSLSWAEPVSGVTDDFDIYVFSPDTSGSISLAAKSDNLVTQSPTEFGSFTAGGGARQIVIRRYAGSGTPRLKFVSNDNGANTFVTTQAVTTPDVQGPTIYGHNGAAAAQTVGAVPSNNSATVESFSSHGPVTHLFGPVNGVTPAPPLASPEILSKPDVVASDRTTNTFFGPGNLFFGTSAAAPHAAAVAALQLAANPALSQAQVKSAQRATADPVGAFGPFVVGSGLIDAQAAIASQPPVAPTVSVSGPGLTSDTTPTFTFATTGDLNAVTCSIDGGAAAPCASPFTPAAVGEGAHALSVTATDFFAQSGSASTPFTVDSKAPKLSIDKGPKKKSSKKKAKFAISVDSGATLECKLDKGGFKACSSKPKFKVKPGKHKLIVSATDAAGNVATDTYKWKVS